MFCVKVLCLLILIVGSQSRVVDAEWERNVKVSEGKAILLKEGGWKHIPKDWNSVCQLCLAHEDHSFIVYSDNGILDNECLSSDQLEREECRWVVMAFCPGTFQCGNLFTLEPKRLFTFDCDPTVDEGIPHSLEEEAICPGGYGVQGRDKIDKNIFEVNHTSAEKVNEIHEPISRTIQEYIWSDECKGKCLDCVQAGKIFALDDKEEDPLCLGDLDLRGNDYPESRKWISCSEVGCPAENLIRIGGIESTKCLITRSALVGFTGILKSANFPVNMLAEWINQRAREESSVIKDSLFNATTLLGGFWDIFLGI